MAVEMTPVWQRPQHLDEETKRKFDHARSTFYDFPQYLFPNNENSVPDACDEPYAYSHHQAAFYWTRQDALSGLIWNYTSRPPCLNCVLAGEAVAKRCNRIELQVKSEGDNLCCKACQADFADACVEMVEIRVVPQFAALLPDGTIMNQRLNQHGIDLYIWTDEEKELRRQGKVIWRPMNLHTGNVDTKSDLMLDFESGGAGDITKTAISPGLWQRDRYDAEVEAWSKARRMMRRKVERWDVEEAEKAKEAERAFAEFAATIAESGVGWTEQQTETLDDKGHKPPPDPEIRKKTEAQASKWETEFLRVRKELYGHNASVLYGANKYSKEDKTMDEVSTGIKAFFDKKASLLEKGRDVESACWELAQVLSEEARDWVDDYMPQMLLASGE